MCCDIMKHEEMIDTSVSYVLVSASLCAALRDVSSTWPAMHLQVSTRINPGWFTSIFRGQWNIWSVAYPQAPLFVTEMRNEHQVLLQFFCYPVVLRITLIKLINSVND